MWACACSIFEIYTGKLLFTGDNDNEMLKQMMILKGPISAKILRKGAFVSEHFDLRTNRFISVEKDRVTMQDYVKYINMGTIERAGVGQRLGIGKNETNRDLLQFRDLMERVLNLDPDRRLSPEDALRHGFFHSARKLKRKLKKARADAASGGGGGVPKIKKTKKQQVITKN